MDFVELGAGFFGLVTGWITYRMLRRKEGVSSLSDIAVVIAVVGGAAITAIFDNERLFAAYSIGLAIGFWSYFVLGLVVYGKEAEGSWMGK